MKSATELQARIIDCDETAYHGDPCDRPSLSQSIAKLLLDKSPRHAWYAHPRLGNGARKESNTFDRGHMIHALVLGKGAEIVPIDAANWTTKAAREARDEAHAAGKTPALAADYEAAIAAAREVHLQIDQQGGPVLTGQSEVSIVWREPVSGHADVRCRGRLDHLIDTPEQMTIVDLKTTRSAHPMALSKNTIAYSYDTQQCAYSRAVNDLYERPKPADFVFIYVELGPPVCVTIGRLDAVLVDRGEMRWRRACEEWAMCLAFDAWPAYAQRPITIEAPPWMQGDIDIGFEGD